MHTGDTTCCGSGGPGGTARGEPIYIRGESGHDRESRGVPEETTQPNSFTGKEFLETRPSTEGTETEMLGLDSTCTEHGLLESYTKRR